MSELNYLLLGANYALLHCKQLISFVPGTSSRGRQRKILIRLPKANRKCLIKSVVIRVMAVLKH